MIYELNTTEIFREQIGCLSIDAQKILTKKLELVKQNPFRNKRIFGYRLFLFRLRFEDGRKEKRVIYLVDSRKVLLICILDRDKDYAELSSILVRIGY